MHIKSNKYVAMFVAVLFLVLSSNVAFAQDVDVNALMAKIQALESKVAKLEGRSSVSPVSSVSTSDGLLKASEDIKVGGYVSSGYNLNWLSPNPDGDSTATPAAGTVDANGNNTNIRMFDRDSNTFVHNGQLEFEKLATEAGTAGFRADLMFGRDAQILNSITIGDATDNFYVEQAYVQYIAPVGNGIDIKAGRFVTIAGAEVVESKDNWNTSRSLLYTNAIPVGHNGVLASYKVNDLVDVKLGLANGWDASIDNNKSKTILSGVTLHPMEGLDVTQNYIIGNEQTRTSNGTGGAATAGNAADRNLRQLLDTIIAWQPIKDNSRWKILGNFDLGWEERGTSVEGVSTWHGLALGTKYDVNDWLTLAGRWEYFNDNDGHRTGSINGITATERRNFYEMTYTADFKLAKNLLARLEWRYDWSNQPIFDLSNNLHVGFNGTAATSSVGARNAQHTTGAEVIYVF